MEKSRWPAGRGDQSRFFHRPYLSEISGQDRGPVYHPYPLPLLRERDVFEVILLDGGAFLSSNDHLGGTKGRDFLRALQSGTGIPPVASSVPGNEVGPLLATWADPDGLEWDRIWDISADRETPPLLEAHVWLHRLYFLLPIARRALREESDEWAGKWIDYLDSWQRTHPRRPALCRIENAVSVAPSHDRRGEGACPYVWFDMQATWRLLVLIHSTHMLAAAAILARGHWERIYGIIEEHAGHVLREARKQLEEDSDFRGNHFLQKGVALLYAGVLLPELVDYGACVEVGRRIVSLQMRNEISADGASVEASPSYSHFIARLFLEAHLLLERNSLHLVPGLEDSIRRQYSYLSATRAPSGKTLQLSDSYAMDAKSDIELVSQLTHVPGPEDVVTRFFKASGFCVLRVGRFCVYVDATPVGLWHHHGGKPNMLVYLDGRPLLVDSGCCNYDRRVRDDWLVTDPAHNCVVLDEPHLTQRQGDLADMQMRGFEESDDHAAVQVVAKHQAGNIRIQWTRTVCLRETTLEVTDRLESSEPLRARQLYHFAPLNLTLDTDRSAASTFWNGEQVRLLTETDAPDGPPELSYTPRIDEENRWTYAPQVSFPAAGRNLAWRTRLAVEP